MGISSDIETVEFEDKDFDDLLDDLLKEIEFKNYRIFKIANVDNIKERIGVIENLKIAYTHYKIVEFCNLFTCNAMVTADPRAGVFLPQRFAVYQPTGEKTIYVSYLKPTAIARFLGSEEMMKVAKTIDKDMSDVAAAIEE